MIESGVVGVGRRRSQTEADGLVEEFEQSGMTRKAFCRARSISVQTLDTYRRKLGGRMQARASQLLPVELVEPSVRCAPLRVELANGRRIVIEEDFDASLLKRVVAALEA